MLRRETRWTGSSKEVTMVAPVGIFWMNRPHRYLTNDSSEKHLKWCNPDRSWLTPSGLDFLQFEIQNQRRGFRSVASTSTREHMVLIRFVWKLLLRNVYENSRLFASQV